MNQIDEILGLGLQERAERERGARTIVEFLKETMNGADRVERRKSLKERLGLKGMSCCGATWGLIPVAVPVGDDDDDEEAALPPPPPPPQPQQQHVEVIDVSQTRPENFSDHGCVGQSPAASGMNLATALAAERQYRAAQDSDGGGGVPVGPANNLPESAPPTPSRTSLMRLLEESDGENGERETTGEKEERGAGFDCMCCVCMRRKKGAAFIPCGHTFCRLCSRELWLNRGSCPLCNRPILEILDIF